MKSVPLLLVSWLAGVIGLIGCGGTSDEQVIQPSEVRTLTGLLRNDGTSPAGQTTGWSVIEAGTGDAIPVDLGGVISTAQQMAGQRVSIKGTMMDRMDASGTQKPVFVAESIQPAK